jgi:hypothetical protein
MACTLATGRALPCKDSVGGIKAVWFADHGTLGTLTVDVADGELESITGTPDLFRYDVKGNSSMEQTINADRANGTSFYTQTLNLTLTKLDLETRFELINVVRARPHVFVEDYNGNYFLLGAVHGCEVTGGTIVTGAAMGDLSGFTLTLTAEETLPAYFCLGSIVTGNQDSEQIEP